MKTVFAHEMTEDGTEVFIEAGRGKVFSNLLKKNKRGDYEVYPLGDMKMCELFKERVSRGIDFGRLNLLGSICGELLSNRALTKTESSYITA